MTLSYQLTVDDYTHSIKACRRTNPLTKWTLRLCYAVVTVVIGLAIIGTLYTPADKRPSPIPLILIVVFWAYIIIALPRMTAKRQVERMPTAHGPQNTSITEEGIRIVSSCSDFNLHWPAFIRSMELSDVFVMFLSPSHVIPLPKRAMTPEQQSELREMLRKHVKS